MSSQLAQIESVLRDVASRFGVAATPEYMRGEIERVANLLRSWQGSEDQESEEKRRRVYYQDIVYAVCNQLDRAFGKLVTRGEGTVCGTVDQPSTQVQDLVKELVDRDYLRAKKEVDDAAGEKPLLQGRRCPKCDSLMYHTRLGGYRCQRGCQ